MVTFVSAIEASMKAIISIALLLTIDYATAQKEFPYKATLFNADGDSINSSDFSNNGNPIIIDFWGSFCKPCIVKYNAMMEVYEKWQSETGVKIIIISIDFEVMQDASKKLIEKFQWPYEAYFDSEKEFMNLLTDDDSVPKTFIFDSQLELIYSKSGAKIIHKSEDKKSKNVMDVMYGGGSMESLTCDLSDIEKAIYEAAKK